MKDRRIKCPEYKEGIVYQAINSVTGDVLECNEVAPLFRQIAIELDDNLPSHWRLTKINRAGTNAG